ncbi:MAG: GDSL-type esterase/lipase family protein [Clostridium sp.]|nr:GDSL-type esterase/lipase family protein [Clostridium sp.]
MDWTLYSWQNFVTFADYDADIVFFGDSLTSNYNFQSKFPNVKILNMGLVGDTLTGMHDRVVMVKSVTPEKIFVMGGINGIHDRTVAETVNQYRDLLTKLQEEIPDAVIYVESILPILKTRADEYASNEMIAKQNEELEKLVVEMGAIWIDLYSLYIKDGELDSKLTEDGLHLTDNAYSYWIEAVKPYVGDAVK